MRKERKCRIQNEKRGERNKEQRNQERKQIKIQENYYERKEGTKTEIIKKER